MIESTTKCLLLAKKNSHHYEEIEYKTLYGMMQAGTALMPHQSDRVT